MGSILVRADGVLQDTTDADGRYRIVLTGGGEHIIRFARIGYAALTPGIEYVIGGDELSDSLRLDVSWPSLSDLAAAVCGASASNGIVVGRVRTPIVASGTEVVVGWENQVPDRRGKPETVSFAGYGVPVAADGSFVLCALPRDREVRLYARLGQTSGAVTRLRIAGRAVREAQVEPPGPDE